MNGFGMKKDLMQVSNPQECSVCNQIFVTPQDLTAHTNTFHSIHHFASSAATAPTTFRHYPNRNPIPAFHVANNAYIDEQGRLTYRGFPAITPANRTNLMFRRQEWPNLMHLFPVTPSEDLRTLPLICQLEQPIPHDTAVESDGDGEISNTIDLTLRL